MVVENPFVHGTYIIMTLFKCNKDLGDTYDYKKTTFKRTGIFF